MRQLTKFAISVREEDFVLHLEADGGETIEFATSPEQLDAIIDALDDKLPTVADHLEDLFLAIRGQAVDFHAAGNDEVEGLRLLALDEQRVAFLQVEQLAGLQQFVELFFTERFEQVVAAQDLLVNAMWPHALAS